MCATNRYCPPSVGAHRLRSADGSCLAGEVDDLDPEEPAVSICDGYFSWLRIVSLDPVFLCLSGVEFYGSLDRKRL